MSEGGRVGATTERTPTHPPHSTRYKILAPIASGATGSIFVGALEGPNGFERRISIRRASSRVAGEPKARRRYVEEARLVAELNHPNVLSVHDVEDSGGELLFITDYVEGVTLSRLNDAGALPLRVAGRILLDAATGLAAIHALSAATDPPGEIIHADVSGTSILVGTDGRARLADVGVAKGAAMTLAAAVFAMGRIAWETFTSRPLFGDGIDGDTLPSGARLAAADPPSAIEPSLTPEIDAVILSALAPNPVHRCSAQTFAAALEEALGRAALLGNRREVEVEVHHRCGRAIFEERRRLRAATTARSLSRTKLAASAAAASSTAARRQAPRRGLLGGGVFASAVFLGAATWALLGARQDGSGASVRETTLASVFVPEESASSTTSTTSATSPLAESATTEIEFPATPAPLLSPRPKAAPTPPRAEATDGEALTNRAVARRAAGDADGAEALYRAALALNARYLPARVGIADLDWEVGRTERARRAYQTLVTEYAPALLPSRVAERAAERTKAEGTEN